MMMMGAALGRKVWYSQDFRKLWPMLNLLLIGPSGIGKSTSIQMARGLLEFLPRVEQPQFITGGATPEALHADLLPNPHAVLFASELANFFNRQKYMEGMVPYVTELLDYGAVEKRTKHGGVIRIEEPSVTVVGGSTVEWLQEQLPDSAAAGGFLARFLIVSEEHKGQRVPCPELALTPKQRIELEQKRARTFNEFYECLHTTTGGVPFRDFTALDAYSTWYTAHQPDTGHLAPFAARAGEFVLRLSMILALSRHNPYITAEDIEAAIELHGYCEGKLQEVVVPFSAAGKLQMEVLKAIGEGGATEVQIKQAMRNFCTSQDSDKMIQSLLGQRAIVLVGHKYMRK
jgi:energy-coupling factor transporter ATP-binding protein EcfA2